jgi:V8-like Glu-specific endopeptidase
LDLAFSITPSEFMEAQTLQPETRPIDGVKSKPVEEKAVFYPPGKYNPEAIFDIDPPLAKDDGDSKEEQFPRFRGVTPSGEMFDLEMSIEGAANIRKLLGIGEKDTDVPSSASAEKRVCRRLLETAEAANQAMAKEEANAGFYFNESPADFAASVTSYPQRAVGFLSNGCSAALFHRRLIFTAAHCLYDTEKNAWNSFDGFTFSPGKTDKGDVVGLWNLDWMMIPTAYVDKSSYSPSNDWGIARLSANAAGYPGTSLGWFGYGWRSSLTDRPAVINLGYPSTFWFTMRQDSCKFKSQSGTVVRHRCDITGGSSGGPFYEGAPNYGSGPYIVADQSGHCKDGGCDNSANRITEGVFNWMNWCRVVYP